MDRGWTPEGAEFLVEREDEWIAGMNNRQRKSWGLPTVKIHKDVISPALRQSIYERDGHTCKHCGATENLSVDHIHPESKGGTLDPENLQTLCMPCNRAKGAR
jgi:5-methylcytosine-specific restriction endonuclease McrA